MPKSTSAAKALDAALAAQDDEFDLSGLDDTPVQRVQSLLQLWVDYDRARSIGRRKAEVDRLAGDRDAAKASLKEVQEKIMPRLTAILRGLVDVLAEPGQERLRDNVKNWKQVPVNLRPHLLKHLLTRGVDVSDVLAQTEKEEQQSMESADG